ncbi:helix-turn-helix protein [Kribbella amoyensis]|uniref:Helix-turn-helix protein n=1 Tax=Kribbella amoyensis TaxID=996641 RepID=A0A561BTW1_9ACTN|nr:helix-turn-helix transcriptional regulator [Kribbella amoyensis]TWD82324.1 helix-turn-helix protein [Kribbella amoyensis]
MDVAHELAVFLRTRRERLTPAEVDLPDRGRTRRTPGLRREEVAELAGVSVDYVIRLEQARGLRPSAEVLGALSRALRLTDDEHAYVFDLTRQWSSVRRAAGGDADSLAALVRAMSPLPAMLVNHRFDICAWNPEMAALMLDFAGVPAEKRNTMWLCTMEPAFGDFYVDREQVIREGIADLRAAWAAHADDSELADLVRALTAESTEFAAWWERHDVMVKGNGLKRVNHPVVGPVTIEYDVLTPLGDTFQRLIVYRAADAASQRALDQLIPDRTLRAI